MSIRTLASFILPLLAVACLVLLYLSGHELRVRLLNADALYLPTLFDDLLRGGGRLSDWYLTPAPYFFPDFPMYLVAWWLAPDTYLQIAAFAVIQCALLFGAAFLLSRALGGGAALPCAACSLTLLAWLSLPALEPFALLLSSGWHFGAFLSAVLLVTVWLRFEDTGSRAALWAACALAFTTTLSDSLFLLQAALPLACACSLRLLKEREHQRKPERPRGAARRLAASWLPAGAALLGHLAYALLVRHHTRYEVHLNPRQTGANLRDLYAIARGLWDALPLAVLGWLAFLAFALACALRLARGREPFGLTPRLAWLLVFWLVSLACMLAVELLVDNLPVAARYFVAAACWPVLLAPSIAAQLLRERAPALLLAAGLACTLGTGAAAAAHLRTHPLESAYYPADSACVDRALASAGLRHGIAQYWDAKPFQRFSRRGIVLAPHVEALDELHWITSGRYFRPAYDFALVGPWAPPPHHMPAARLEAINGLPQAEVRCGAYTLLLYGHDKLKLR